jgi:nucleotide-binding universal stress UspA family protein
MTEVKVLIPLDGSELAESSLAFLPLLATQGQLTLRLIGVVEEREFAALPIADELIQREAHLVRTYLESKAAELRADGYTVSISQRRGQAAECILDDERTFRPDFVLISTHGRSGLTRWRLGSIADKVIRGSEAKVLVAGRRPATWPESRTVHSVLVPLDGSDVAERALPVAESFARGLQAELHLAKVISLPMMAGGEMTGYVLEQAEKDSRDYLAAKESQITGLTKRTVLLEGDPAGQLLAYLEENRIGLVVLTSHGRGGWVRVALGSVADRLIGGPAPVLIIPAHAAD